MRTLFLFLLSCLPCLAQFGVEQPMFQLASAPQINPQTLGANHWWIFSSMPTNINVTNWVDSIAGSTWTNIATATTLPTNSSMGVHFVRAENDFLTNSGIPAGNSSTVWIIINRQNANLFQYILSANNGGDQNIAYYNDNKHFAELFSVPKTDSASPLATTYDFAFVSQSSSSKNYFYTNGFPTITNSGTVSLPWIILGGVPTGGFLGAYIYEIAIWTNTTLSASSLTQLHNYGTNKYSYTP